MPPQIQPQLASRAREPLLFAIVSLAGWVLDFALYNLLVYAFGAAPLVANYASSIAGSTFAFSAFCWYSASHGYPPRVGQIVAYVAYQLASISVFSLLIGALAADATLRGMLGFVGLPHGAAAAAAKLIATPLNFITNYISTRTILRFLRPGNVEGPSHAPR